MSRASLGLHPAGVAAARRPCASFVSKMKTISIFLKASWWETTKDERKGHRLLAATWKMHEECLAINANPLKKKKKTLWNKLSSSEETSNQRTETFWWSGQSQLVLVHMLFTVLCLQATRMSKELRRTGLNVPSEPPVQKDWKWWSSILVPTVPHSLWCGVFEHLPWKLPDMVQQLNVKCLPGLGRFF